MAFELKVGQWSLWPAKERKQERSPNATGTMICPHCETRLRLAAWTKDHQGTKWLSGVAEEEESKPAGKPAAKEDLNDDISF